MSSTISALQGDTYSGFVTVAEQGPCGMITVRGDLSSRELSDAVREATGLAVPQQRRCLAAGAYGAAWMSPDELLLMTPHAEAAQLTSDLTSRLAQDHALAVDVSDARALIRLEGAGLREVIAKLSPVDMSQDAFQPGSFRRTRLAQIPAALWLRDATTLDLICFRSVARYAFDILKISAHPGTQTGFFSQHS